MHIDDAIAIIGTGCRFPGNATTPSRLWDLLQSPKDLASKPPPERFNMNSFHRSGKGKHGMDALQTGLFLEQDPYVFDAPFFGISPLEATSMDPQQRLLMETVYEALERAGIPLEQLQGSSTGVFCGSMNNDHNGNFHIDPDWVYPFHCTGVSTSILANRLSYFFDWHGPSVTMDTACSSSLIAVHSAVNALQRGNCSLAVCAGSNLMLSADTFHGMTQLQVLSLTGRCHMWDDRADGYARGEGVSALILKPLALALRDGDEIECLIRATGANSDGRTQGMTVPNGKAQLELIQQTYARAGLNPLCAEDRCQYFEAHGTGTQVGDPQEAYAISHAFFNADSDSDDILQVGSIKTIIGHTESSAGIAGIIKASLAIKHGLIPPNQHFEKANPAVVPYLTHLRVPTKVLPWPELPAGVPRRASVNSFGFGGANAHVILESFDKSILGANTASFTEMLGLLVLPFVFSAENPDRLGVLLQRHIAFLDANPATDLVNLAASLIMRRSNLPHRLILVASSVDDLQQKLQKELEPSTASSEIISSQLNAGPKQILGVFTGQGAQYAQMGWDLISNSPQARLWLAELQEALDTLPEAYRPNFSLVDELSAPRNLSRINTAEISQPLRTALQIIYVKFLRTLGITFAAVVGHSSGEIGAAYAAGRLSAVDAIRVAYLRGLASSHARGVDQKGGMMAVAISWEQAQAICAEEPYAGKVVISASNSPSSVTLSGDADLLQELEWLFRSLDRNPRRLQVDTAYHSYHMDPCAGPYLQAMEAAQIQTSAVDARTKWFSSVFRGQTVGYGLDNNYWKENMLRPVLFYEAITAALDHIPNIDAIVEVGPHPALQGPTMQTLSQFQPEKVDNTPYIAVAHRKQSSLETLATAVGSFWSFLGAQKLDIPAYVQLFLPSRRKLTFIHDLPTYPWDHRKSYKELPRMAVARMHRPNLTHSLLGALTSESGEGEWRWRNYLCIQDVDWLEHHQVQSQIVFPATGYVVLAHEAAAIIANGRPLRYVDIEDLIIDQAITISEEVTGTETLFTVQLSPGNEDSSVISGHFTCQATFGDVFRRCCSGRIRIILGETDANLLPSLQGSECPGLRPVDTNKFYRELSLMGYGYNGIFRGLSDIKRRKDAACGLAAPVDHDSLQLHPATLDMGLQSLITAIGAPGDSQITEMILPNYIARVTINSGLCPMVSQNPVRVESTLTAMGPGGTSGDVEFFDCDGNGIVQIEGVSIVPLNPAMTAEDQFGDVAWGLLNPNANRESSKEMKLSETTLHLGDRICLLYLQEIQNQLTDADRAQLDPLGQRYVAWLDRVLSMTREGRHPHMRSEYLQGDAESLLPSNPSYNVHVVVRAAEAVRQTVVPWLRGQASLIEALRKDNVLDEFYEHDPLINPVTDNLARVVEQIAFRYPNMKILEVGAGTGSATRKVFSRLAGRYHSYIFTDISAAFFEKAEEEFCEKGGERLSAELLNIELDPVAQGFPEQGYDLVIASNVLHATRALHNTMGNIRRLLKPGGRIAIVELIDPEMVSASCIFGGFEGWWLGAEQDGRIWSPIISVPQWESVLQESGFDSLEVVNGSVELESFRTAMMVARVSDARIQRVNFPLSVTPSTQYADLLIVGGASAASDWLVQPLRALTGLYFKRTTHIKALDAFEPLDGLDAAVVLVISDLDSPYLDNITVDGLQGLQKLLPVTNKMLWITPEGNYKDAYLGMSRILLATLRYEYVQAWMQHLTVADSTVISAEAVATSLLRLAHTNFKNDFRHTNIVETFETELRLEKNGTVRIPRLQRISAMNQRLQGSRGLGTKSLDPQTMCVQIRTTGNGDKCSPLLVSMPPPMETFDSSVDLPTLATTVRIHVHYATLQAIRITATSFLYVVIGKELKNGKRVLALASENASFVSTKPSWTCPVPASVHEEDEAAFLNDVSAAFVAEHLVQQAQYNSTVLINEPGMVSQSFYSFVTALASVKGVNVRFWTSSKSSSDPHVWHIASGTPTRTLSRQLPADVSLVATFGSSSDVVFQRIKTLLQPFGVSQIDVDNIYQYQAVDAPKTQVSAVANSLSLVLLLAQHAKSPRATQDNTIQPDKLPGYLPPISRLEVVDWVHADSVPAQTIPASSLVKLSAEKTYLLVGMTGEIGLSVAHWIIERGARYVVLTSRNPNVDSRWIDEMAGSGAHVLVIQT